MGPVVGSPGNGLPRAATRAAPVLHCRRRRRRLASAVTRGAPHHCQLVVIFHDDGASRARPLIPSVEQQHWVIRLEARNEGTGGGD